jgi:hypothetical protein
VNRVRRSTLLVLIALCSLVLQAAALAAPPDKQTKGGGKKGGGSTPVSSQPRALILHADTGDWRHLGELFALQTANLMGRFGTYEAKPVSSYRSGDMAAYTATFYIGSTWREEVPEAFMEDVLAATRPVIWMEHGIHELAEYSSDFEATTSAGSSRSGTRALTSLVVRKAMAGSPLTGASTPLGFRYSQKRSATMGCPSRGQPAPATSPTSARSRSPT